MTCVAVIVVPLVVPSTTTLSPVRRELADVAVPFSYVVEDVSLTVTFWPAAVVIVKPDEDTVTTAPDAPPAAGPERALDPAPADPRPPAAKGPAPPTAVVTGVVDGVVLEVAADDEPPPAASAKTAINAPARTPIRVGCVGCSRFRRVLRLVLSEHHSCVKSESAT